MASVNSGSGFTKTPNELMENLIKANLNASHYKILLAVIRYTYGYGKDEANISQSFLRRVTGISDRHMRNEFQRLIDYNIIKIVNKYSKTKANVIKINNNYEEWCIPPQRVADKTQRLNTASGLTEPEGVAEYSQSGEAEYSQTINKTINKNINKTTTYVDENKIKDILRLTEHMIDEKDAEELLVVANNDLNIIKEKFVLAKASGNKINNLVAWLSAAIVKDYKVVQLDSKQQSNTFNNFSNRHYDTNKLKKALLEKSRRSSFDSSEDMQDAIDKVEISRNEMEV